MQKGNAAVPAVPVLDKEEITFSEENIVQIMAVSILKNSIYVVSEYINGRNLDEVLFGEGEESTKRII